MKYRTAGKRIVDVIISFAAIVLLSPILIITIALLFITNKKQVFFRQQRPGRNGKIFHILKFKTMTDERDKNGYLLPDDQRLTKIGQFIRSTSIDELPQLINVLMGDMSIVGPRPLLVEYLPIYNSLQSRRHEVKPGITGWAQCNGRNSLTWSEKFDLDVWYVDHISFRLDIKIIVMTIGKVIYRSDISSSTSKTMEAFNGKN